MSPTLAAIGLLRHEHTVDPDRIFVLGHSQGGTYAPLIAKRAPEVTGVILLAAGAEPMGSAMLRQTRYLATLPGTIGATAKAELPDLRREVAEIDDPAKLERDSPGTVLLGGAGQAYYLSALRYDEVATATIDPPTAAAPSGGPRLPVVSLCAWAGWPGELRTSPGYPCIGHLAPETECAGRRYAAQLGVSAGTSGDALAGNSKKVATRIVSVVPGLYAEWTWP
jgi:pimeloyl-ACP methyl ester carboxylesterase